MNNHRWWQRFGVTALFLSIMVMTLLPIAAGANAAVAAATPVAGDPCERPDAAATPAAGAMPMGTPVAGMEIAFDLLFIDMMIPHHAAAVAMAEAALARGEHEEITNLAAEVIDAQSAEVDDLRAWRDEWYPGAPEMPMSDMEIMMAEMIGDQPGPAMIGMSMDPAAELAALCTATGPFDRAFIGAMIPHHQSAIAMAKVALERSTHPELKTLHLAIIDAQQREIEQMTTWRNEWYGDGTAVAGAETAGFTGVADLRVALADEGVRVRVKDGVAQPFLDADEMAVARLRGGALRRPAEVWVYAYDDREAAAADAAMIGPDGQPEGSRITWVEPPHFYRQGDVIVLYLGTDDEVLDLLRAVLGEPFATGEGLA